MDPDEVAHLFDERPGYRVVDFQEVGLPIYRLVSIVLTLQPKAYSPIEEFVLRSVEAGLDRVPDVAGFLGVNEQIVEGTATSLIKDDDIVVDPEGRIFLTPKSQRVLLGEQLIRPREQSLVFYFDGLTRQPTRVDDVRLLEPRHLKDRAMREIRPFPAKRPAPEEISGEHLQRVLRTPAQAHAKEPVTQILQVKSISKAYMNFIPAVALIYRSDSGRDVQVGFVIDGRLSKEHENHFAAADGPSRMGITASIAMPAEIKDDSGLRLPIGPSSDGYALAEKQRRKAISQFKKRVTTEMPVEAQTSALSTAASVEMVPVYEHPPLLREALETANKRLIIISPWITDAVVDADFLRRLKALLEKGVGVHIGYGLGEDKPNQVRALQELHKLAAGRTNLSIVRLGDTHAKILIKDSDWLVTTSFNWLSFKGDPNRTFREEWGTKVGIVEQVDNYAGKMLQRLAAVAKRPTAP